MWVVGEVTENQQRAEPVALFPLRPLPHIQPYNAAMWVAPPWRIARAPPLPTGLDERFFFKSLVVGLS